MKTNQLLDQYYRGLKGAVDWEALLTDDFSFVGGDTTKPEPLVGRDAADPSGPTTSKYMARSSRWSTVLAGSS